MKIESLRIDNFHCIKTIDIALPAPLTLLCGPNGGGKSSFIEAIKFAMLGDIARVDLKKNYAQIIRDGEKNAVVVVNFAGDARAQGVLPSGKRGMVPELPAHMDAVLDPPRIASMDPKERRKYLYDAIGVNVGYEAIVTRLVERGCDPEIIQSASSLLRAGFDQAEKHATERLTELRAQWAVITKEEYGSVKAETWAAPYGPKDEAESLLGLVQHQIEELDAKIRALGKAHAVATEQAARHQRYKSEKDDLAERSAKLTELKEAAKDADRKATAAQDKAAAAKAALVEARAEHQPCPACSVPLAQKNGKLLQIEPPTEDYIRALESEAQSMNSEARALDGMRKARKEEATAAQRAADMLDALKAGLGDEVTETDVHNLKHDLDKLEDKRILRIAERDEARAQVAAATSAAEQTSQARKTQTLIKMVSVFREAVSSSGVPADILAQAITPLNERMRRSAEVAKWPIPQLDEQMSVQLDGRPYRLWSESYRWRADAILIEAISFVTGTKLLMLDRLDVLEPAARMSAIAWARWLVDAHGYGSIIIAATLKEKPKMPGINVAWVEGGGLS